VHYPCYQSLTDVAQSREINVIQWWTYPEHGWELDLDFLKTTLEQTNRKDAPRCGRVKAIVINCPHNPTGYTLPPPKLRELIDIATSYDVVLFSDEVYRFMEWGEPTPPIADLYHKGVSLGVMSKSFGLAGLRIGWIATRDAEIIQRISQGKDYTTICSAGPSELLATLALRSKDKVLERTREIVQKNLQLLDVFFEKFADVVEWARPRAGPIGFPRLKTEHLALEGVENIEEICEHLVKEKQVLLLPGTAYDPRFKWHFRVGFGRENMPVALEKLAEYLSSLKQRVPK